MTGKFALVAAGCALALVGHAYGDAIDDGLARIEAARAGVRTLSAEFTQTRAMGLFVQTVRTEGRLAVARPDRVRWEIATPVRGVFVVDRGRVAYRAGDRTASATQGQVGALGSVLSDLATFLGGPLRPLRARYRLSLTALADGRTELTASPLDAAVARVVARVALTFRADLRAIDRIEIYETGTDRTTIDLRAVQLDVVLPPSTFQP